jgi:calcium/calmodulin dependent protein kinase II association protein
LANVLIPNQQVVSVKIDSIEVRLLSGNMGLVAAWTTNVINADNKKSTLKISYQDVYMKRKNKWVAVAAHVTLLDAK